MNIGCMINIGRIMNVDCMNAGCINVKYIDICRAEGYKNVSFWLKFTERSFHLSWGTYNSYIKFSENFRDARYHNLTKNLQKFQICYPMI